MHDRPQKITLGEMRESGVRGVLIYCSDYECSHWTKISVDRCDQWPDEVRLSDLEPSSHSACSRRCAASISSDSRVITPARTPVRRDRQRRPVFVVVIAPLLPINVPTLGHPAEPDSRNWKLVSLRAKTTGRGGE